VRGEYPSGRKDTAEFLEDFNRKQCSSRLIGRLIGREVQTTTENSALCMKEIDLLKMLQSKGVRLTIVANRLRFGCESYG
jgi:hypothetical protein